MEEEEEKSWRGFKKGMGREKETIPNKSKVINRIQLSGRSGEVLFKFIYALTPIPTPTVYGN